jgi:nitric oxide reductase NorQ protein
MAGPASGATPPYYRPVGHEVRGVPPRLRARLPVLLKGPTGCGKSRFVEAMAARARAPARHRRVQRRDLAPRTCSGAGWCAAARPSGRTGPSPARCAGRDPLPRRGRRGARGRDRRHPPAERSPPPALHRSPRRDAVAAPGVHARRELQPRLPARAEGAQALHAPALRRARLRLPRARRRGRDRRAEAGVDAGRRRASSSPSPARSARWTSPGLAETVSTRLLVSAARLIRAGLAPRVACAAAVVQPLTDDPATAPSGCSAGWSRACGGGAIRPPTPAGSRWGPSGGGSSWWPARWPGGG